MFMQQVLSLALITYAHHLLEIDHVLIYQPFTGLGL